MNEQEELRSAVEKEYGRRIRYPKDCNALHLAIKEKLGIAPSASTLRRFFGLEKGKSGASRYTLDLLARYCGFLSSASMKGEKKSPGAYTLPQFSQHSIKHLKSKAVTGGKGLIRRGDLFSSLMDFLSSDRKIFFLNGKPGMGKTSFLLSLFQEMKGQKGWEVFLFDMSILGALQSSGVEFIRFFEDLHQYCQSQSGGAKRLFLIDALDEFSQRFEKQKGAAEALLSIVTSLAQNGGAGVNYFVFSCRPTLWNFFYERTLEDESFSGIVYGKNLSSQKMAIGRLERGEIAAFLGMSLEEYHQRMSLPMQDLLCIPLMLKLSLQTRESSRDPVPTELELLLEYSLKVVYRGKYSLEKRILISRLLEATDYGLKGSRPRKKEVFEAISACKPAYNGLLQSGVIFEQKLPNKFGTYTTYIHFFHEIIHEFLLAQHFMILAEETGDPEDQLLLEKYGTDELRLKILLWIIRFKIREKDISFLETAIEKIVRPFSKEEQQERILFTEYLLMLKHELIVKPDLLRALSPVWAKGELSRKWFTEIFVNVSRINQYYGDLLEAYYVHSTTPNDRTFSLSLLALRDFLREDRKAFSHKVATLNKIEVHEVHPFPLARKVQANLLLQKIQPHSPSLFLRKFEAVQLDDFFADAPRYHLDFPLHIFILLQAAFLCNKVDLVERCRAYEQLKFPELRPRLARYYDFRFMDAIYFWVDWKLGKVEATDFLELSRPAFHLHSLVFDTLIYLLIRAEILEQVSSDVAKEALDQAEELARKLDFPYFLSLLSFFPSVD